MKIVIVLLSIIYSLLRYGWAADTPLENWPAYIGNKALAFCAVSFLSIGLWQIASKAESARSYFRSAAIAAVSHGLLSAALLRESYYAFLHTEDRLNIYGELTALLGAVALALIVSRQSSRSLPSLIGELALPVILVGHVVSVGILKWLDPSRWKYGLVPISLLSFMVLLVGIFGRILNRRRTAASINVSAR